MRHAPVYRVLTDLELRIKEAGPEGPATFGNAVMPDHLPATVALNCAAGLKPGTDVAAI